MQLGEFVEVEFEGFGWFCDLGFFLGLIWFSCELGLISVKVGLV